MPFTLPMLRAYIQPLFWSWEWSKYQTMTKPMALFSILYYNLIIWYKHFIVSLWIIYLSDLTVKWEMPSFHQVELKVSPLPGSINYMCISAPQPPVGCPACDWSGFRWTVLSSQAFQRASDQETTVLACTCGTLHPTRAPQIGLHGWCD